MTLISRNLFMKSQCRSNFVLRPKDPLSLSKFSIKNFVKENLDKENLDKVSVVTIKVFFIIFVKELEGNVVSTKKWLQLSQIMKTLVSLYV